MLRFSLILILSLNLSVVLILVLVVILVLIHAIDCDSFCSEFDFDCGFDHFVMCLL